MSLLPGHSAYVRTEVPNQDSKYESRRQSSKQETRRDAGSSIERVELELKTGYGMPVYLW